MSAVVLGIDGGGTRTRASIVNGDEVLAFAEAGSIKRLRVGAAAAEENLRALLAEVYKQAGVDSARCLRRRGQRGHARGARVDRRRLRRFRCRAA